MVRYISLLLFIGLAWGQSKMDINNLIDRGGLLYKANDDKPFSGSVFEFYDNGQKKLNGRYRNGTKNGKWTWWNEDGGTDSTGSYKNGLMNGQWEFYFSNGKLNGKGQYKDGNGSIRGVSKIPRNGRYGIWTFWYESGEVKEKQNWKNGKIQGINTHWYRNGQKKEEGHYIESKMVGLWTLWYENGQKMTQENFEDGKKNGFITYWYNDGKKWSEGKYKNGKKEGLWSNWVELISIKDYFHENDFKNYVMAEYKKLANLSFDGNVKAAFKPAIAYIKADRKQIMDAAKRLLPMSMAENWILANPNGNAADFKKLPIFMFNEIKNNNIISDAFIKSNWSERQPSLIQLIADGTILFDSNMDNYQFSTFNQLMNDLTDEKTKSELSHLYQNFIIIRSLYLSNSINEHRPLYFYPTQNEGTNINEYMKLEKIEHTFLDGEIVQAD